jgi:hypothetical protein
MNNNGILVWAAGYGDDRGVFLYDGSLPVKTLDTSQGMQPSINDNGYVVWSRSNSIAIYNGSITSVLPDLGSVQDQYPLINANNHVVWFAWGLPEAGIHNEILYYDGTNTTRLTNDTGYESYFHINSANQVVWTGWYEENSNNYTGLYLHGTSTTRIDQNINLDSIVSPVLNNRGEVLYKKEDNSLHLYSGTNTVIINQGLSAEPKVYSYDLSHTGVAVWAEYDDSLPFSNRQYCLYVYDGSSVSLIVQSEDIIGYSSINDYNHICYMIDGTIYYATPILPTGSLNVTIEPAEAVTAGAQWRINQGQWQNSGQVMDDLSIGTYEINFKLVPGWRKPTHAQLVIVENQTTNITTTYQQASFLPANMLLLD